MMKLCDGTVTVFNARVDPETGESAWTPTVIVGAGWFATDAVAPDATRGGLAAASRVTVRIPLDADTGGKAYADPVGYASAEDASGLWTLKGGDIVVRAEVTGADWTPARLKAAYADCAVILGVTDNRRAPRAAHWRIAAT